MNMKLKFHLGITEFFTTIFVILKLTGVIDWHWLLVLLPSLIAHGVSFAIVCFYNTFTSEKQKEIDAINSYFKNRG